MTSNFRKVVFFILLIGLSVVGYQYMIKPANKNLAEIKSKVDSKLEQLVKFEEATAAAEDITKQLDKLQEAIEFFESKLPPKSQIHEVLEQVTVIAQKKGCTLAQLAIAWLLSQGDDIVPIPGTKKVKYLEENVLAVDISLNDFDIECLEEILCREEVHGERYSDEQMRRINK